MHEAWSWVGLRHRPVLCACGYGLHTPRNGPLFESSLCALHNAELFVTSLVPYCAPGVNGQGLAGWAAGGCRSDNRIWQGVRNTGMSCMCVSSATRACHARVHPA